MPVHHSSDTRPNNYYLHAWLIFILSGLFYAFQFTIQVSPDTLGLSLQKEFAVSEHRLGLLTAAFFLAYTLMQIPAGILIDRLGAHRLLSWAAATCSLGCVLFASAHHIYMGGAARLLMGAGSAFAFIGALKLVANWFPRHNFTLLNGTLMILGMLGGVLGEGPLTRLIATIGWRYSMLSLGGIGFIIAILLALFIKNSPHVQQEKAVNEETRIEKRALTLVTHNKQLWLISLYTGLLSIVPMVFCSLYGIPFLKAAHAISDTIAASLTSLILIGIGIGSPIWGWLSDRSKRRLPTMLIAAIGTPLIFAFILYRVHLPLALLASAMFLLGFCSCATLPAFSMACEISKPSQTATALAFINSFDTIGGMLALPLIGRLLGMFAHPMNQNIYLNSYSDYRISLSYLLAIICIPLFLLPFIRETHAKACL